MRLRGFVSISASPSNQEIGALQATLDERRSKKLTRGKADCLGSVEQPTYSSNVGEDDSYEVHCVLGLHVSSLLPSGRAHGENGKLSRRE